MYYFNEENTNTTKHKELKQNLEQPEYVRAAKTCLFNNKIYKYHKLVSMGVLCRSETVLRILNSIHIKKLEKSKNHGKS